MTSASQHDDAADLHVFILPDGSGLAHPHTPMGWEWLAATFGIETMTRYQIEDNFNPSSVDIQALTEAAEEDGLVVQRTYSKLEEESPQILPPEDR